MSNTLIVTPRGDSRAQKRRLRALGAAVAALLSGIGLSGCKSTGLSDITGSIRASDNTLPRDDAGLRQYTQHWGTRYDANPADRVAAVNYARGLRTTGQYVQAVAVLQQTALRNPNDLVILGAYGKALADAGRLEEAADVLQRAHTPERPNWSILSAQGSVADQMGDHAGAQAHYEAALKIAPNEPSVMSNLGLSYALTKQLPRAEQTLRQAAEQPRADMRVRQNLALVLSLEGKFAEAEQIGRRDLSADQAATNVLTIRRMIAQSNNWRDVQKLGPRQAAAHSTDGVSTAARVAPAQGATASRTQAAQNAAD